MAKSKKSTTGCAGCLWFFILAIVFLTYGLVDSGIFDDTGPSRQHACIADEMNVEVNSDGSLHVVDARTYKFTGSYTLVGDILDPPARGEAKVNGVSVIRENGERIELEQVAFDDEWRYWGGPDSDHYAVDVERDTIYAFSDSTDEEKTFVFDYTYTEAIDKYLDVCTLYWQFIPSGWDVDTKNVITTVTLPVAAGESVSGGENVNAWGHGNLDGKVSFTDDGRVCYEVPIVKTGTFAEMRIAFPATWASDMDVSPNCDYECIELVRAEEQEWIDETIAAERRARIMLYAPIVVSLLIIIIALVLFLRFGREYRPEFRDEYWRDVPASRLQPAVIARLWRWNEEDSNDLIATLMHLSNKGIVSIERITETIDRKVLPDKVEDSYVVVRHPDANYENLHSIDREALSFVFHTIGRDENSVTLQQIREYGKKYPNSFMSHMEGWQKTVDKYVKPQEYFEKTGQSMKRLMRAIAVVIFVFSLGATVVTFDFWTLLCLLPAIVALFAFSHFMPRRSKEAVEIYARCKGLKRWFKDFTNLEEAIPTDAKVWGELLVYAYIFGVMDDVVEDLNRVMPEIFQSDGFTMSALWYSSAYGSDGAAAAIGSGGSFLQKCIDNTASSAHRALQADNLRDTVTDLFSGSGGGGGGGGGFSGGGGGGFSGGGGGGFGGGGGGFAR